MTNYAEILVVDDMPDQIAYSSTLLRAEGYRVFVANCGKATVRFLEKRIPDLILLDIQMNDINGIELCQIIKSNSKTRDIPIIFLTSETSPEIISKGFEVGGCDYVKKPFSQEEYLARIKTHLQISSQQRELTAANQELSQFCSAVSHDLKAPFNIINMLIEMLRGELGDNPSESISDIMDMITDKSVQTKNMIERLLDFSKMCNVKAQAREMDPKPVVLEVFSELKELEPSERQITFECGDLPNIIADEMLLRIMMKNLLSNALKYTSKREKTVIEMLSHTEQGYQVITVRDNGAGFDMAYSQKLFKVFQRLHSEDEFEGTGVGLALIHRIMQRHGGMVQAYGEVDKGAEFSLWFPKR